MGRTTIRRGIKVFIFSLLALSIMSVTASCTPGDTEALIASILKNTDSGQMTFITEDGETVTVTVTKTGPGTGGGNENPTATPKPTATPTVKPAISPTVKPTSAPKLADYLPVLNCIEDVFKTLGVWEKAAELKKAGYTWSHIAGELGYDRDTMYARILELNAGKLGQAKELGLIDQATLEYKTKKYGDLALKWIGKIFAS